MDLPPLPGDEEVLGRPGGQPLRRAEANARGLARHRRAAPAAPRRRAEQGAGPGDHRQHDRGLPRAQARHDAGRGRAELPLRALARRTGSGDGLGPHRPRRGDGRSRRRPGPAAAAAGPEPRRAPVKRDWIPIALVPELALAALPLIPSTPTWVSVTVAGLAMGMMIFIMASGLTLVFGVMDVMTFAHGVFISVGAYAAASVLIALKAHLQAPSLAANLGAIAPALLAAVALAGVLGWFFERIVIRPVYGDHLKQILVTMGGLIVVEQLILVVWGPDLIPLPRPATLTGAILFGDAAIERYRVLAVLVGLAVFAAMWLVLNRTRIGLLVRAGVENSEMVESLGYRIRRLFVAVFVAGSALAGLGGLMWAMYQESVSAGMGMQLMVVIFIVIIIGGLGSVGGCFVGALLVGLLANYIGYLAPQLALGSNILLMLLVLLWRPRGLYPAGKA